MRLIALNGFAGSSAPWRGAVVVRAQAGGVGVLVDPTAALAARLEVEPALRRRAGLDGSARAVVLSAAPLEQVSALIEMRHGAPIELYTSPAVFESLTQSLPVLPRLQPLCPVHWRMVPVAGDRLSASFSIHGGAGLRGTAAASAEPAAGADPAPAPDGEALALAFDDVDSGRRIVWLRRGHRIGAATRGLLHGADAVVVESESDDGPTEPLVRWLASLRAGHKLLLGGRAGLDAPLARLGIARARDGMEIAL
ncbi:MAG: hypothetical protein HYZ20_18395 [Burkholderiales bacterium]|nr:hypothetical protein [Burkholderiales bacterium]